MKMQEALISARLISVAGIKAGPAQRLLPRRRTGRVARFCLRADKTVLLTLVEASAEADRLERARGLPFGSLVPYRCVRHGFHIGGRA
jgi:hypothetical protein